MAADNAACAHRRPAVRMLSTPSRREVLESAVLISLGALFPRAALGAAAKPTLESELTPVVMCRTVLNPVRRYIETGRWDRARTNVNYCSRVLGLKKRMRGAGEFLEGDAYFDALEIAADLDINLTQLDASVYTPLFISGSDDDEYGISVEQRKYQNAALNYYDVAVGQLDEYLSKIPPEALEAARALASKQSYEITVEQ